MNDRPGKKIRQGRNQGADVMTMHCDDCEKETCPVADRVGEAAAMKVLARLGVGDTMQETRTFQANQQFLYRFRKGVERAAERIGMTVLLGLLAVGAGLLWLGLKAKVGS